MPTSRLPALTREENQTRLQENRGQDFQNREIRRRQSSIQRRGRSTQTERPCEDAVLVSVGEVIEALSIQALIPAGFESGRAFPNRSPKVFEFSMTPESAYASVP